MRRPHVGSRVVVYAAAYAALVIIAKVGMDAAGATGDVVWQWFVLIVAFGIALPLGWLLLRAFDDLEGDEE